MRQSYEPSRKVQLISIQKIIVAMWATLGKIFPALMKIKKTLPKKYNTTLKIDNLRIEIFYR